MGYGSDTRRRRTLSIALLLVFAFVLAACGDATGQDEPDAAADEPASGDAGDDGDATSGDLTPATLRFTWTMKGEYAPLYLALDRDYFEDEGIDLSLEEGSGSQTVFSVVARGQEEVAFGPAVSAAQAVSQGVPLKVIALYNPAAPMVYISWPDNPVEEPKDLEGKTLATSVGETSSDFLPVFCEINDVDCDAIDTPVVDMGARVSQFMARDVDVVGVYRSNDLPILEDEADTEFVTLDLAEHGMQLPGSSIITSEQMIERDPETLQAILRAANRGFEDAIEDPRAAAEAMLNYWDTDLDVDVVEAQVRALTEAVPDIEGKPLGWQEEELWTDALDMLLEAEMIDEIQDLDWYFTNALLE